MTFNTAVSGLRAASDDLAVISNNVANASTAGFKSSRSEFGDVYAASSSNQPGAGVLLQNIKQQFSQGTISFSDSNLDMAINGSGLFILDNEGETSYSRAGYFGLDNTGTLVNNSGKAVQGYSANENGTLSGELSSLAINAASIDPNPSTEVDFLVNIDARSIPPADRGTTAVSLGGAIGDPQTGIANGYPADTITFTSADGSNQAVATSNNDSAAVISSAINSLNDVSSEASTEVTLSGLTNSSGTMNVAINGVVVGSGAGYTLNDMAVTINDLTTTSLVGMTASIVGGDLVITSNRGDNIITSINNTTDPTDVLTVGGTTANEIDLQGDGLGDGFTATVGGTVTITMGEDIAITSTSDGTGLFAAAIPQAQFVNNDFDAKDQETYNHSSSVNIYDSQGVAHVLSTYFVKESSLNTWTAYVLVDGEDVGDPNSALEPPFNVAARPASFNLEFNPDGSLNEERSDPLQISYWNPIGEDGERNGSEGGAPLAESGGEFIVDNPPTSSNFEIELAGTTQFGSSFSVNNVAQNGYQTGRLLGLDINQEGIIFSRFTNGQTRVLGQVALANFNNVNGLQPAGDTEWVESFDSGAPNPGTPGSASLGLVQAGAIEESNVDLSQELVKMIVAQRNFQANARTIQTADTITQAIINIR